MSGRRHVLQGQIVDERRHVVDLGRGKAGHDLRHAAGLHQRDVVPLRIEPNLLQPVTERNVEAAAEARYAENLAAQILRRFDFRLSIEREGKLIELRADDHQIFCSLMIGAHRYFAAQSCQIDFPGQNRRHHHR